MDSPLVIRIPTLLDTKMKDTQTNLISQEFRNLPQNFQIRSISGINAYGSMHVKLILVDNKANE